MGKVSQVDQTLATLRAERDLINAVIAKLEAARGPKAAGKPRAKKRAPAEPAPGD